MDLLVSILLGIVQGLTEFLPISSSGHLIVLHDIFNLQTIDNLIFDVALHLGTLVALLIFFYNDIIRYFQAFLKSFMKWNLKDDLDQRIAWLILISMIPAGIVGYFFENIIEQIFRSVWVVAIALILVGVLFFIFEKYSKKEKDLVSLNWLKVFLLGLAQAVALIPGVSRSGITIITGLGINLKREVATRFSFLMSIPIIFVAGVKKLIDLTQMQIVFIDFVALILGFLSALLVGYLTIKYFLQFVKKYSLNIFGIYRIFIGVILLIYLLIK